MNRNRMDRLLPGLAPEERVAAMVRIWKSGAPADQKLQATTPASQESAVRALLDLAKSAALDLGWYVVLLDALVQVVELEHFALVTTRLWSMDSQRVLDYLLHDTQEPIVESDYAAKVAAVRAASMPIGGIAELLVDDEDETDDLDDAGWEALLASKEALLREAVARAELVAVEDQDEGLSINLGSYDDWRGEASRAHPEWGMGGYEVRPDSERARVERQRKERTEARRLLQRGACAFNDSAAFADADPTVYNATALTKARLRRELPDSWRQARTIELVAEELAERLGGEEPLDADIRVLLEGCKARLLTLRESCTLYLPELELQEPHDEDIVKLLDLIEDGAR